MAGSRGKTLRLTLPRKWVGDILHFSAGIPIITGERGIRVRKLIEARRSVPRPPSWQAIILKAFGLVSDMVPELRRSYLSYPYPRLHEMPYSVGTAVIDREYEGERAVFCAPLLHPERLPLAEIQRKCDAWKVDPVSAHGPLRRQVRTTKLPRPLRRWLWWFGLRWAGYLKGRYFGTFAVNCLAGMRGRITQMCFPTTTYIYYGVPEKDGTMPIQYGFDHRVYDGYTCARAVGLLEEVLAGPIREEVLRGTSPAMLPTALPTPTLPISAASAAA